MPILTKEMPAEREVNKRVGALHELLMKILSNSVAAVRPTVITVASCNDLKEGLWLLHHPDHDKAALVKRLRLAADEIDKTLPGAPGAIQ
jgi:hypothetical protein